MGRRRKKEVKIIKKTLPEFYLCPRCGKNTIKATVNKKEDRVTVTCNNCGLNSVFPAKPQMDEVDAYNVFIDSYYGVKEKEENPVG